MVYPDPDFVRDVPQRTWPHRRASWATGLRAEAADRLASGAALGRAMRAAEPAQLERIWQALTAGDPELAWLRRDVLADLYAQPGYGNGDAR